MGNEHTLPTDSNERKNYPLMRGCLNYFPAALAGVARWSKLGNDKHNPGEPLHHARGKSMDHGDCIMRHLVDLQALLARFERQPEKLSDAQISELMDEADALSWRSLAMSQELRERFAGAPLAPAAKPPTLHPGLTEAELKQVADGVLGYVLPELPTELATGPVHGMGQWSAAAESQQGKLARRAREEHEKERESIKAMRRRLEGEYCGTPNQVTPPWHVSTPEGNPK